MAVPAAGWNPQCEASTKVLIVVNISGISTLQVSPEKLTMVLRFLMGLVIYTVKFLRSNLSFIF